jgi:hypothetical protein
VLNLQSLGDSNDDAKGKECFACHCQLETGCSRGRPRFLSRVIGGDTREARSLEHAIPRPGKWAAWISLFGRIIPHLRTGSYHHYLFTLHSDQLAMATSSFEIFNAPLGPKT